MAAAGRLTIIGGEVLAQLAVQRGTVYDIGRFAPARFAPASDAAFLSGPDA